VSLAHRAEFAGYRGLSSVFSLFPFPAQRALALGLGWLGGSLIRVRRAVVDENLQRAFPEESSTWRNRVARASYRHLIRETLATTRFTRLGPEAVRTAVRWDAQEEIRDLIDRNYERAETILKERMDVLHAMTDALMKYETIDTGQIDALMEGREVPAPQDWVDLDDDDDISSSMSGKKGKKDLGDGTVGGPAGQH
jgi:hypothetical protein